VETGRASTKADLSAALTADGDASFERLRLLERLLGREMLLVGRLRSFAALRMTDRFGMRFVFDGSALLAAFAADFLAASRAVVGNAVADAFRFLGMGLCVVAAGRRLEIAAGVRCC
jgi:hypothetical protein